MDRRLISRGVSWTLCLWCSFQLSVPISSSAKSICVCIGLNELDPTAYGTNITKLSGCDSDAADIATIASRELQCSPLVLINDKATRTNVLGTIISAEHSLSSNDIIFVFFSGHGGQIPDQKADAKNGADQTWCLYDGQLLDVELYAQWSQFTNGTRILVISDSCHSEGISKLLETQTDKGQPPNEADFQNLGFLDRVRAAALRRPLKSQVKALSMVETIVAYQNQKSVYDTIISKVSRPTPPIQARVLSISACLDDETAGDAGPFRNSVFTRALRQTWRTWPATGDYAEFTDKIAILANTIRRAQHATSRMIDVDDPAFWQQRPFTLNPPKRP